MIAPHADDEAVGCGGLIARASDAGHQVRVLYGAVGGLKHRHLDEPATFEQRVAEIEASCEILGVEDWQILWPDMDMRLDMLPNLALTSRLDELIDGHDEVYIPYPSHNHDHQAMHHAALAALRPGAHAGVRMVAMFEYVYPGWAQWTAPGGRMYVDISDYIQVKCQAVEAYTSQVKPSPNPLSVNGVRALAALRGLEVCLPYAELYHVIQTVR